MTAARHLSAARARGFTLAEVMVAAIILSFVTLGCVLFTVRCLKVYYTSNDRLLLNKDIRNFTEQLTNNATYASYYKVYTAYGSQTADANSVGNYLVLVTTVPNPANPSDGTFVIKQVSGFYLDSTSATTPAPIRMFASPSDLTASGYADTAANLTTLLGTYAPSAKAHTNTAIVQTALGKTTTDSTGIARLFFDDDAKFIMIKAQLEENSNDQTVLDTYNFTLSPRS